jgi:hypothetical protein
LEVTPLYAFVFLVLLFLLHLRGDVEQRRQRRQAKEEAKEEEEDDEEEEEVYYEARPVVSGKSTLKCRDRKRACSRFSFFFLLCKRLLARVSTFFHATRVARKPHQEYFSYPALIIIILTKYRNNVSILACKSFLLVMTSLSSYLIIGNKVSLVLSDIDPIVESAKAAAVPWKIVNRSDELFLHQAALTNSSVRLSNLSDYCISNIRSNY